MSEPFQSFFLSAKVQLFLYTAKFFSIFLLKAQSKAPQEAGSNVAIAVVAVVVLVEQVVTLHEESDRLLDGQRIAQAGSQVDLGRTFVLRFILCADILLMEKVVLPVKPQIEALHQLHISLPIHREDWLRIVATYPPSQLFIFPLLKVELVFGLQLQDVFVGIGEISVNREATVSVEICQCHFASKPVWHQPFQRNRVLPLLIAESDVAAESIEVLEAVADSGFHLIEGRLHLLLLALIGSLDSEVRVGGREQAESVVLFLANHRQIDIVLGIEVIGERHIRSHMAFGAGEDAKPVKLTTQNSLFMDSLKEAVRNNMSNPNLKMDDLGEQLGISRVQLYRKVKVLTGLSPIELLRQMRLERGKVLLNSTTKTVAEIAFEVGFGTPSYFTSCFKKQYGKLPMEHRSE